VKTTIAALITTAALTVGAPVALATGIYHGPDQKPRWLTTPCQLEDDDNCYWDAHENGGTGHSFWAIPLSNNRVAVVYWNPVYNHDHGYVTQQ
jgi:hypothetical protein